MIRLFQQDNRATKAVFAIVIGAAIFTMVITLVPGIFDNSAAANANVFATIHTPGFFGRFGGDSSQVTTLDVQRQAAQIAQQQGYPAFAASLLVPRVGEQMVARAIAIREADRLGLQVSDGDLKNYLQHSYLGQYIFPDGKFIGEDAYMNFVQRALPGASVSDFETEVKSDLEMQRLQALVTGGVMVADNAVRAEQMEQGTKIKFDYAVVSASDIKKTLNPSDTDLQAFFKQNAARYANAVPETRKVAFFSFDASNLPGGKPQVTDADLQAYYNAHQADYKVDEQVKTRHILISSPKGGDAKADAAAKAKAEDVLKQVRAGGNFAELAKKYSDDPGSKENGGELGMQPTSMFVPEFSKAAMALNPGQTSDLVRSQFGYHIIQTEQKQAASVKPLADVKAAIQNTLEQQKAGAAEQNFANQLASEAGKQGLDKAAAAHGMHVTTTDYLPQTGTIPSLADSTTILKQAFSTAKGAAPAVASTGEGFAVFQVQDVKAAHAPEFADYKPHLLDDYREQQAPEMLNAELNKLAARAKALGDLKKAAVEMKLPVKTSDLVGREAQVTDLGSMGGPAAQAFSLAKGEISGPINEGPNGAVLQITDKQQPTPEDLAKSFGETKDKLLDQKRSEAFQVFVGSLMDRYQKAGAIIYSKAPAKPLGR